MMSKYQNQIVEFTSSLCCVNRLPQFPFSEDMVCTLQPLCTHKTHIVTNWWHYWCEFQLAGQYEKKLKLIDKTTVVVCHF